MRCSAGESPNPSGSGTGGATGEPRDESYLNLGTALGGADSTSRKLDPLCGAVGTCIPDDADSCSDSLGGAGGESSIGQAGGLSYDPGDLASHGVSCQATPQEGCEGTSCPVERTCRSAGTSPEAAPCVVASDCAPGLACVGDGVSGLCRPYCCEGSEASCEDGYYCDERRLTEHPGFYVPVCMPVDDCPLTDPFPCPDGQDCACQDGRACVVVRADGSTACTQPGPGQTGDPCTGKETAECAYGFVCSPSAGCMKICSAVSAEETCPGGGTCQSPPEFPKDLGVCIGSSNGSEATK